MSVAASSRQPASQQSPTQKEGVFVGGPAHNKAPVSLPRDSDNMQRDSEWLAEFQWKGFKCWADLDINWKTIREMRISIQGLRVRDCPGHHREMCVLMSRDFGATLGY